jgi:hypothetical protein
MDIKERSGVDISPYSFHHKIPAIFCYSTPHHTTSVGLYIRKKADNVNSRDIGFSDFVHRPDFS